jgi:hypothetical protein
MSRILFLRAFALMALAASGIARAAPPQSFAPNRNATGTTNIILPATITKLNDLDFGALTVTTAGTALIDSNTDIVTTTGGVLFAGASPHAARFAAVSPSRTVVRIQIPNKPCVLTRAGGTETMTLDTWNINGATTRTVVAHETFEFKVGGTLHVGANQVEGVYTGTFDVIINYN